MARLGEIRLPSLVVVGGEDRLTPPKYSDYLARSLADAKLEVIERAGHFVSLEQPDAVNRAVRDFLGRLGPS
jgi:3-oxoadipate enol-lactonase